MSATVPARSVPARTGAGRPGATRPGPQLHIDWTACDGRGLCVELLPELLEADPWGYPVARHRPAGQHGPADVAIPPNLLPAAQRAVADCPLRALRINPGT